MAQEEEFSRRSPEPRRARREFVDKLVAINRVAGGEGGRVSVSPALVVVGDQKARASAWQGTRSAEAIVSNGSRKRT